MFSLKQLHQSEQMLDAQLTALNARRALASLRWSKVKSSTREALGSPGGLTAAFSTGLVVGALRSRGNRGNAKASTPPTTERSVSTRDRSTRESAVAARSKGEDPDAQSNGGSTLDAAKSIVTSLIARFLFTQLSGPPLNDATTDPPTAQGL